MISFGQPELVTYSSHEWSSEEVIVVAVFNG